ncbi:MAG TPA: enoyl-CoA hydratase family protein [Streptosporangiaceae bacterium]|jgi:enoyl-CoA hydratase|nr:enoyl-CoA hydratase family protein [Streptosporangiaceae bacterium]
MADELVQYSAERGIARIALDSPRNRNALSAALVEQVTSALAAAAADEAVRAVELTHTGTTFCAGADLSEARQGGMKEGTTRVLALLRHIVALAKPVVGSIDGHVRAGGLGLVGACDIVLAGPASTFAFSEVKLGLAPAMISLTTLPRLDPRAASRYYLTGETFDAATAARIGLITEAVDDIDAGTLAVLDALRLCSPQGLRETKPLLTAALLDGFEARAGALAEQSARLFASDEAREGMASFLEKRPPSWAAG